MIRIDKYLADLELGTRSEVKNLIKKGLITIDGTVCKSPDYKFDENICLVCFQGKPLIYKEFEYYMLNKPQNVVSATQDNYDKTVLDLLKDVRKKDLFPVGRLDKDTEGLLLITNDGALAHSLLSPKKHVNKTYFVGLHSPIEEDAITKLENGVDIGEDKLTLPAKVTVIDPFHIELTIHEGKFHQVKRMLQAVSNEVTYLKRISFGSLTLDSSLNLGEYRELTEAELCILKTDAGIEN